MDHLQISKKPLLPSMKFSTQLKIGEKVGKNSYFFSTPSPGSSEGEFLSTEGLNRLKCFSNADFPCKSPKFSTA